MIVDDSAVVREVMQDLLKRHPDIQVIGVKTIHELFQRLFGE